MVRVEASETGLRGPVVSSEQMDEFTRTGEGAWVLARSDVRQLYQGAAYRTPIRRVLALPTHDVNAPDFDRAPADRVRFRSTRSCATRPRDIVTSRERHVGPRPPGCRARQRQGALLAGLARADARVRRHRRSEHLSSAAVRRPQLSRLQPVRHGTQFNGFFGGSYGQMAFSVPSIARQPLAARGPCVRHRLVLQRSGRSRRGASNTIGTSASARHSRRCGCSVR